MKACFIGHRVIEKTEELIFRPQSGTKIAYEYAKKSKKEIINLYKEKD